MYLAGYGGQGLGSLLNPGQAPAPPSNSGNPILDMLKQQMGKGNSGGSGIWYAETGNELPVRWGGPSAKTRGPLLKIADVKWEFWRYSDSTIRSLAGKLAAAGFLDNANAPKDSVWDAYRQVLMEAAQSYAANGGRAPTVQQILNRYQRNPVGDAAGASKRPEVYTQTQSQVNLTDPKQASAMLSQVLQDRLGRAPSAAERNAFVAALNAAEEANPVINKTTYRLNHESGAYDTSSTSSGGVDASGYLASYAEKHNQKEFGAYQAASTYMNAFMQAIGAPVG